MSSHWYDKQGNTAYEVLNKTTGGMRPTTLADAKKLGYVPSVTTIIAVADKPFIHEWYINQIFEGFVNTPREIGEHITGWLKKVRQYAEDKKGTKQGNEIHKNLEKYFKHGYTDESTLSAISLLEMMLPLSGSLRHSSFSEASFYSPAGFGGQVDLHNKVDNWIVDFKTKNKEKLVEKDLIYDAHSMQLAAYRKGLDIPTARCYNLFISTVNPTQVCLIEHTEKELEKGLKLFNCLLEYWKLSNNP